MSPVVKRKKEKFTLAPRYLLLLVSLLCAGLLSLTYVIPMTAEPFRTAASYLVVPFQNGISVVGGILVDKAEMLAEISNLQNENELLRRQISELTEQNTSLQQERYELARLRELYELDEQYSEYEKTGARIIAKDSGSWYHSFIINKGSDDGLLQDMNVIADGGLIGRITTLGPHWARVLTIIDDNSNVSAQVLSTSDSLIVTGNLTEYERGVIDFSKLRDTNNLVSVGDKVVTSNISDKYLPGILIGYISSIEQDSNNLTKSGTLVPCVDFEKLDTVLVIKQLKESAEETEQ